MINNSSLELWSRLQSKTLDQQFVKEIIHGLSCSPFEASAVLDTVHKVFGQYFETNNSIRPGQISLQVIAIEAKINQSISNSKIVTVTLTINNDQEDLEIRQKYGIIALRRHKIYRISHEAFDQGGLLTVEDLAFRIFNCGTRTICRDLEYFRTQGIFIPLRSTVKDIGRTLSHKLLIIRLWAQGKEYSEIANASCHSLNAIQNYIDKFKRTISLSKENYDVSQIAFLLKLSIPLVQQYIELYNQIDFIEHREIELDNFLKKDLLMIRNQEGRI